MSLNLARAPLPVPQSPIRLMPLRAGDPDPTVPDHKRRWYALLLGQAQRDPALQMQLDVGPPPGTAEELDLVIPRIKRLFLVLDSARPLAEQYCGVVGCLLPPTTGKVQYRVPLVASIVCRVPSEPAPSDVAVLAAAYRDMAAYLLEGDARAVEVRCLGGMHEQALRHAGFLEAARIPAGALIHRHPEDVFLFTKGPQHGA